MLRRFLIILAVVLVALGIWAWMSASSIIRAERDLEAKFNAVVTHYVDMKLSYVDPLLRLSSITEQDKAVLTKIGDDLSALATANGVDAKHQQLLASQRSIIQAFTSGVLSEKITIDPHYLEWNTQASNSGKASDLILQYNRALNVYNVGMRSVIGSLMKHLTKWTNTEYISIDGKTTDGTIVSF